MHLNTQVLWHPFSSKSGKAKVSSSLAFRTPMVCFLFRELPPTFSFLHSTPPTPCFHPLLVSSYWLLCPIFEDFESLLQGMKFWFWLTFNGLSFSDWAPFGAWINLALLGSSDTSKTIRPVSLWLSWFRVFPSSIASLTWPFSASLLCFFWSSLGIIFPPDWFHLNLGRPSDCYGDIWSIFRDKPTSQQTQ